MLNPQIAEALARKYLLDSNIEDGKFFFAHTESVVSTMKILSEKFSLDKTKMISLAWVHDVGYFYGRKDHAENSLKILEEEKIELDEIDRDCILNHGNGKTPKTKEGKLMQIADKISFLNEDFLKVLLSKKEIKPEEIDFVKNMCENAVKILGELNKI